MIKKIKKIAKSVFGSQPQRTEIFVKDFKAERVYEISDSDISEIENLKTSLVRNNLYNDVYCEL